MIGSLGEWGGEASRPASQSANQPASQPAPFRKLKYRRILLRGKFPIRSKFSIRSEYSIRGFSVSQSLGPFHELCLLMVPDWIFAPDWEFAPAQRLRLPEIKISAYSPSGMGGGHGVNYCIQSAVTGKRWFSEQANKSIPKRSKLIRSRHYRRQTAETIDISIL